MDRPETLNLAGQEARRQLDTRSQEEQHEILPQTRASRESAEIVII